MDTKPFRLRHTNEITGAFVLLAIVLALAGIVLAGRAQGWFERRFEVLLKFETEEGAFGLAAGNEVRIRNALAGRVEGVVPTPDGNMEAVLSIKERFHNLVTEDSVAKVKMKFGVAGDAFVVLERGKGAPVASGAYLSCRKDQEILEMAKKTLSDVQAVVLPLLDETKMILQHVNGIVGEVEKGNGLAGTLLHDRELADKVESAVDNVNYLLQDSRDAVEASTRLIKGAQKHWMIRKYIDTDDMTAVIAPRRFSDVEIRRYGYRFRNDLQRARAANNSAEIARNAYNLAVCLLSDGEFDAIRLLIAEADAESGGKGAAGIRNRLLEAEVARRMGDTNAAIDIASAVVKDLDRSTPNDTKLESRLILGELCCSIGGVDAAKGVLKETGALLRKTESPRLKAMAARVSGMVLQAEGHAAEAAVQFDVESGQLREAGAFYEMAMAMQSAGRAHVEAGNEAVGAERLFRAGRSLLSGGYPEAGQLGLGEAGIVAERIKDPYILSQLNGLTNAAVTASSPTNSL